MKTLTLAGLEEYQAMLAAAMDGFAVVDAKGRVTECNDALCEILDYSREELLGMSVSQLEAKETPEDVSRHLSLILQQGRDRFETRLWRKGGRPVDVEVSASRVPGEGPLIVAFLREIGTRKRVEARLIES